MGKQLGEEIVISSDQLESTVKRMLDEYSLVPEQAIKETVDEITKETVKVVKDAGGYRNHRHRNAKTYRSCITSRSVSDKGYAKAVWAGKEMYYLSHLLEKGHQIKGVRSGGRTRAFPHFKAGELYVQQNFEKKLIEKLEK